MKILQFWRTELSYAQKRKRGEKIRLLDSNKEKEMKSRNFIENKICKQTAKKGW